MGRILTKTLGLALISALAWSAAAVETFGDGAPASILPKLHMMDQTEVQAGQMGRDKACRGEVAQYGLHLVRDHAAHAGQVERFAEIHGVDLDEVTLSRSEEERMNKHKEDLERLEKLQGCAFDNEFLTAMLEAHEFSIELTQNSLTQENSGRLRAFLEETLDVLQMHKQMTADLLDDE